MKAITEWRIERLKGLARKSFHKLAGRAPQRKEFAGRSLLGVEEGSETIFRMLGENKPCMICRYGGNELEIMVAAIGYREAGAKMLAKRLERGYIYTQAGFFPRGIESALEFAALMEECSGKADYIGVWDKPMEEYAIRKYALQAKLAIPRSLEPWYGQPVKWTKALQGKKVLVIHPFIETIERQYQKRSVLFANPEILPEFELKTVKAVQTIAGERDPRFNTWFEALEYMYQESMRQDFDIAILGCGAYGFPLAAKLKDQGKKAIHMGGATQILFGIKGARWDEHPVISKLYNDNWVRPSGSEKPSNANAVEGGCYW